ncbi:SHOCT domain-containing protein [Streptomyces beihaiensis]|uniref:SHOCT domain-containing protein n=1 Tax=Streptomyces beihaiensis TaxID=2984495 RepID=A0ABT3TP70_9ACTN|nr:SHOCT domain-containing protein [Streptomyces beihaiensis]MCX3058833.1 SHOCT domain-containing protein [Streptomyces beihaiensis]
MPRRIGRPGLLGTVVRTAVISGTATAVGSRVERGMARRDVEREATDRPMDRVSQLKALADLKGQGLLTEEEFAAEKAHILNS